MTKNKLTISDLFKVKAIKSIRWSPDGKHAVVVVGSINVTEQRNETALWLYDHQRRSIRQITFGPADSQANWLDAETILFIASKRATKEEENDKPYFKTRFYTMSISGGEPALTATVDGTVSQWQLSPSRKKMALILTTNPVYPKDEREAWKKTPCPKPATSLRYKMDGQGYLADDAPAIYVARVQKNSWSKPEKLTKEPIYWDNNPQWLDEKRIIFSRWHANRKDSVVTLHIVDDKGKVAELTTFRAELGGFDLSPDRTRVIFFGNPDAIKGGYMPGNVYIRSVDPKDKEFTRLTDTDGRFGDQNCMSDIVGLDVDQGIKWIDNETVVCLHGIRGHTALAKINVHTKTVETITGETGVVHCFDTCNRQILYACGYFNTIDELYLVGRQTPISRLNNRQRAKFDLIPQRWQFESEPGVSIDNRLWITAEQLKAKKRSLPLVLYVHGGPQLQVGDGPFHEYAWLAHNDFPVLMGNPRGSTGYGAAHATAIFGNWGDRDVVDILAMREDVLKRFPQFDPKRVFICGGSYGGYMTNMMITRHPGLFRAAITQRSICNIFSFAGTSDFGSYFPLSTLGLENVWADPVKTWERSPLAKAMDVITPTLIIHSDNDQRCPIGQAEELFNALVESGRKIDEEVRLIIFRNESHGLSRSGRPENRKRRLEEILNWLKKHDK